MPAEVTITGSFICEHEMPVRGWYRFTPQRLWVFTDCTYWATLAPEGWLKPDGSFSVQVTATDADAVAWMYHVECPAGVFRISVPYTPVGYLLKDLVYERHPGQRPQDRR